MTNATTETDGFGLSTWNEEVPQFGGQRQAQSNEDRIPFLRLKPGDNELRVIAGPYKYHMVRYKGAKVKAPFGARVNCSYPKYDDCPTKPLWTYNRDAGEPRPKVRFLVGVIQRGDEDDPKSVDEIRIFDMSIMIYKALKEYNKDKKVGDPKNYDINVRYNPEADPQSKYTIIPRGASPLSEEDVALINDVGTTLEEDLLRLATPPSPEKVTETLKKLGWDGTSPLKVEEESEGQELQAPKKDDFGFPNKHPAAPN